MVSLIRILKYILYLFYFKGGVVSGSVLAYWVYISQFEILPITGRERVALFPQNKMHQLADVASKQVGIEFGSHTFIHHLNEKFF